MGEALPSDGVLQDASQKLRLSAKLLAPQARLLSSFLNGGEIYVSGEILFARIGEEVVTYPVVVICTKCSACA